MAKKSKHPSQEELRITQISLRQDKVVIEVETLHGGEKVKSTMSCDSPPLPDFEKAFRKFGKLMCELMEFSDKWTEAHKLKKIEVKYEKDDGRLGCVATIFVQLSKFSSGSVTNSPYQRERVQGGGGGQAFMPEAMCELLKDLIVHARDYYNGERAQGTLLKSTDTDEEENAEEGAED